MKSHHHSFWLLLILFNLSLICFAWPASAEEPCDEWMGRAVSIQGDIQIRREGGIEWQLVKLYDAFCPGDMVRALPRSRAAIVIKNGSTIRLDQNSTMTFAGTSKQETILLKLIKGAAHIFSRVPRKLKITTPFVNGAVEGTEFLVRVDSSQTIMTVYEGRLLAYNAGSNLRILAGRSIIAEEGKAIRPHMVVSPRDAVRWALYYPPVFDFGRADQKEIVDSEWAQKVGSSMAAYQKGDLTGAFSFLEGLPDDLPYPNIYAYQAALLLSVGQVDQAHSDIERTIKMDPSNVQAVALSSIVALVQNDKAKALQLAQKAISLDPDSSTGHVALSYARQADFDLQGSLQNIQEAVRLDPDNALARARLAEIWLSLGYLNNALKEAIQATALNPNLERTQTVLGYAYLTQIKIKQSKEAFARAIMLDQAAPLPRLGLGLAMIRSGDLETGRQSIEIAASLDPNTAIIRSYLGKAYFDEKRDDKSGNQYAIAKQLDPDDPTPYFYDAIRKQTENRPVEALQDLQKSIELNDNRAVYRSRLLLDEDLAARSASLARIYNDLGFEQLALVEGWKSVNTDPGSYSAHRFLADAYATLPRHEIARVSELLQSQLLQPLNVNPVQPHQSESSLFIHEGAGPSETGFNEYNPLFLRNRVSLLASGLYGENETLGGEGVISAVYDRFSASVGGFHYQSDGYRENNDQEQDIYNAYTQLNLFYGTSLQAEYRSKDSERGDLSLLFEPDSYFKDMREEETTESIRIGLNQKIGPMSDVIFSYNKLETDYDLNWDPTYTIEVDESAYSCELGYIYSADVINANLGIGHYISDREAADIFEPFDPIVTTTDITQSNAYGYLQVKYPFNVNWTFGMGWDSFEGGTLDLDSKQFSPKFGLTWNLSQTTTFRAAALRSYRRSLIASQTIEPTQLAGFNQFYNDAEGTDSKRYGIGLDQAITNNFYIGAEFSRRYMEVPGEIFTPPDSLDKQEFDIEEDLGRFYIYWTPSKFFSIGPEYQYERFKRPLEFTGSERITNLNTHRFTLNCAFFHPNGFGAKFSPIFINQYGDFFEFPFDDTVAKDDQFVILNASIEWRLPKRLGQIAIEAKNLLDESFSFQDTDPSFPKIYPEQTILGKFTFSF
jgi:tetratricopeptide (TPR) repeat protein